MPRKGRTSQVLVSAAIFIVLEVAAIAMLHSSSVLQDIWLNRASHRVAGWIWGGGSRIAGYFKLDSRNKMLQEENARLSEELRKYRELEKSEEYLSRAHSVDDGFDYIFAHIVKMGTKSQRNYIILDKGLLDGVGPDCGIVTSEGVIGVIDAADEHIAYGRTLMNPSMHVSVRIGRDGVAGPLSWNGRGSRGAVLSGIPLGYKAEVGDTLWTSGYSAIFPAEIPVGIVMGSSTRSGAAQDVEVELLQDFNALDYVTVVRNRNLGAIEVLEQSTEEGQL
ncbi:MAG: rod shape-determining protein MreC [Bacteroidales bacterium]|nr:rod shape-determining protein MreC [Bacteroidales bacterium]